ncbi:glycosyl hydrolases family 38 N-terminal domain-containing protein [Gorgonomyces haynaldii]|nr:glycosyl hydrolases family 38 N-terminal domain-containing protein [Gorgonomyces haynaldii]
MQKHTRVTIERIEKYLQSGQFSDVNLYSFLYDQVVDCVSLSLYSVPGLDRISFQDAIKGSFKPTQVGVSVGPTWSTHWFKLKISVPSQTRGKCVLMFDSNSEGMVWSSEGVPLQGLTGGGGGNRHVDFLLTQDAQGGEQYELYVEVAANGLFGAGAGGDIHPPDTNRYFKLETCHVYVVNDLAHSLYWDFEVLLGMAKELPVQQQTNADALFTANAMVNAIRHGDKSSLLKAKEISNAFFEKRSQIGFSPHTIWACGNCHIDTAWLWPYGETKRKIARSWASQCQLLETYPEYVFAASQAQQFEWLEQLYPSLMDRIRKHVKTGRFIPIGGTWVEMDCNIPSGEALCRQFLYGQRYFEKTFGVRSSVFWLPDTFGYSAQLPQIIKSAGLEFFFTQKLSWNLINKFPHTSFIWKGLDGTGVVTHFSPADTYTAQATVKDVVFAVENNKDKLFSNQSLLLYGNGDGGGGPLIPMIERLKRFYKSLPSKDLNVWQGELYFELHRGTYTSHAIIKKYNRMTELLLRDVEILYSWLQTVKGTAYPRQELDRLWKLVLLNQFHDVLPGSSIGIVYDDAIAYYEDVVKSVKQLKQQGLDLVKGSALAVFNTKPFETKQLIALGEKKIWSELKPLSWNLLQEQALNENMTCKVVSMDKQFIVENNLIKAIFNQHGHLVSLVDLEEGRQVMDGPGNVFRYYEDIPLFWDAWDVEIYHLEKHWEAGKGNLTILETSPERVVLKSITKLSETSTLEQRIIITYNSKQIVFENDMFWDENRKVLKVEFPVHIKNDLATYETQFGFIQRPTHFNNSWDLAKFEVCAHKFVDYSEFGYGVTLYNDCKYGFSVKDNTMRMTVVRAPKSPDDKCDIGKHSFRYAIEPHKGGFAENEIVQKGYQFNIPTETAFVDPEIVSKSLFKLNVSNVIIDTVKATQDPSKYLVLRLYEAYGGRGTLELQSDFTIKECFESNVLEEKRQKLDIQNGVKIGFTPFKLITLLVLLG